MPVPKNTKYRYKKGTNLRLSIHKGKVREVKKMTKKHSFGFTSK